MRNLRKFTAVLLAVALVLTSMTAAFAATEDTTAASAIVNGDKAAVLKELKLYEGTDENDPTKGLDSPLQVQQALIFLAKEFGYISEAQNIADEDVDKILSKFADANEVSDYAKKVVAYSVQEGVISGKVTNDGKYLIAPKETVTAARFATFMLKAMGYDVASWNASVAQLAEVDGSKIDAALTGDLSRDAAVGMMYGILTAKTASGKTVAENLLAADSSLQAVLSKNSLLPVNGTLAVDSVMATANNKVTVTLKEAATATAADFSIVKKGTTTAVAVKDIVKESDKVYTLETDALTGGASYTLTVNGVSVNFTGLAADTTAPTIVKVNAPDTNKFEIEFSDKMDYATATDVANYTWDKSLKTVKAELNGDRNKVTLTTDAAKRNVYYTLTVANVKNSDGKAISKTSRNIKAVEDRTAPKLDPIKVQNNRMLILTFQDTNGMNKESLETVANYSISDLSITSAKAYDTNSDDKYETVVLMTETQTANKSYTLTIENLTDNSVLANPLGKTTRTFRGAAEDKTAPTVKAGSIKSENNNQVTIEFTDNNAMDAASLEDISNYSITYGSETLDVISAKAADTSYPDGYKTKKVTLTTAAQETNKTYKLEVKAVADEFGNVLKQTGGKYPVFSFRGSPVDTTPPYIVKTEYVSNTEIKLHFDNAVDKKTAEDPTNYSFNKDIGSPIKAALVSGSDDKVVKLTTPTLSANTTYTITMNNIEDKFGNAMSNVKVDVLTNSKDIDTTVPSISYIYSPNNKEVHIYFDEKIAEYPSNITVQQVNNGALVAGTSVPLTFTGILDDGKTLVYTVTSGTFSTTSSADYVIASTTGNRFADEAGNKIVAYTAATPDIADRAVFTSNTEANSAPVVEYVEQVNVKKLKVVFSEPVSLTNVSSSFKAERGNTDIKDTYQSEWIIKKASGIWKANEKVTLNLSGWAKDLSGAPAVELDSSKADTEYITYMEDDVKPVITNVAAVDRNTIEVTYDEDIELAGTYRVVWEDPNNSNNRKIISLKAPTVEDNVVTIKTNDELELAKNYVLTVLSGAKDVAGNMEDYKDVRWDFAGSDVKSVDLVKGVGTINAKKIYVTATKAISNVTVYELGNTNVVIPQAGTSKEDNDKKYTVTLKLPLLASKNYRAVVTYAQGGTENFDFEGSTPDIGLTLVRKDANTVTLDLNGYTATDYAAKIIATTTGAINVDGAIAGTPDTTTADTDDLTFGTDSAPANASEYYVVLSRVDDNDTVVYASKVEVVIPDDVARDFMTTAKANFIVTGLSVVDATNATATIQLPGTTVANTFGTISWSAAYGTIENGVYTTPARPSGSAVTTDTLTATITIGSVTETVTYTVDIPSSGAVTVSRVP